MAIELATQFQAYTDEQFYSESKTSLVTNKDFSFDGAKTIKLYKVKTTDMEDFNRNGPILDGNKSQYGTISTLQATTETFTINKDRSFTFEVDKMDTDETKMQVAAASALARQQREKVFPEIDSYVYSVMAANAGIKPEAAALTAENIYLLISPTLSRVTPSLSMCSLHFLHRASRYSPRFSRVIVQPACRKSSACFMCHIS